MNSESEQVRTIPFGKAAKHTLYPLDRSIHFTNHGSYGTAPKMILEQKRALQDQMESCPDRWMRFTSLEMWEKSLQALADFLKVDKSNVLLFENATESVGTVLKWVEFRPKDAILTTAINYQAVLNAIDYTSKYRLEPDSFVKIFLLDVKFPILNVDDLVNEFDKLCGTIIEKEKLRLRLAVVDHIASSTAILYPIEKICKVIRKWASSECIILIDGAHAIGQIDIDFSPDKFHADFYLSNLHKWFFAPRSCAFLYTANKNNFDYRFQPCYISHGYSPNPATHSVSYNHYQRGTRDNTSFAVVPECIQFHNYVGGCRGIQQYTRPLLEWAVEMLEREWGTKRLQVPDEMLPPFMRVIKLPELESYKLVKGEESNWENKAVLALARRLLDDFNVVAFIGIVNGELYCRITCFIYNEKEDYVALKKAILKIKNSE